MTIRLVIRWCGLFPSLFPRLQDRRRDPGEQAGPEDAVPNVERALSVQGAALLNAAGECVEFSQTRQEFQVWLHGQVRAQRRTFAHSRPIAALQTSHAFAMAGPRCKCVTSGASIYGWPLARLSLSFFPALIPSPSPTLSPLSLSTSPPPPPACLSCVPVCSLFFFLLFFPLRTDIPLSFLDELTEHAPKRSGTFSLISKGGSACGDVQ